MAKVIFRKSSYEYARLRADVFEMFAALGHQIRKGSRVLIKPNLLRAASPERAVTTHPLVIRAAAEYALSEGASVKVGDSPATGSFGKIARQCGLEDALRGMPVEVAPLEESQNAKAGGKWASLELSRDALEADVIINAPKLKTHTQMVLTLAVKNLFGCVIGMRKPEWHFRVGEDRSLFAELLVAIYERLRPSINLLDGVLAMEGTGPGVGGTPREIGVLAAGDDALSLDMAVCGMLRMDTEAVPTNAAARLMGLDGGFEASGEWPVVEGFAIPDTGDILFGPKFASGFLRRHIASRPSGIAGLCRRCGECERICPADAVREEGGAPGFDYKRCIRCYCCLEVCPEGAIKRKDTLIKKALFKAAGLITGRRAGIPPAGGTIS